VPCRPLGRDTSTQLAYGDEKTVSARYRPAQAAIHLSEAEVENLLGALTPLAYEA
jgi:hypothetical protein